VLFQLCFSGDILRGLQVDSDSEEAKAAKDLTQQDKQNKAKAAAAAKTPAKKTPAKRGRGKKARGRGRKQKTGR